MDDLDRPPLGAYAYEQIEVALYKVDTIYWKLLRPFQIFAPPIILQIISGSAPSPQGIPKQPLELIAVLNAYAMALFDTEFREYPSDLRLPHWMMKLAERTGDRVMRVVAELEVSSLLAKLSYHGVTASQMRESVEEALRQSVKDRLQELRVSVSPQTPGPELAPTASQTVKEPRKAFVMPLLNAKGWSVLDWATEAKVSHATAMDYLQNKTAPYRSTRLKLAKALGITVEELPE